MFVLYATIFAGGAIVVRWWVTVVVGLSLGLATHVGAQTFAPSSTSPVPQIAPWTPPPLPLVPPTTTPELGETSPVSALEMAARPTTASLIPMPAPTPGPSSPLASDSVPVGTSYLDLDSYLPAVGDPWTSADEWSWQLLPSSLIYKSYLAGLKEPRFASQNVYVTGQGWVWDAVLGARVGLLRYGNRDPLRPDGLQLDAEGAAMARLVIPDDVNLYAVDFRGGMPLTYGYDRWRTKFGYYHLSSHLGDEFLLANPGYPRQNYSRDCLVLGESYYLTDDLRIYGEVAWAFQNDVGDPWEFQFGIEYAPVRPTGAWGAPFAAVNTLLRQELNYGGTLTVEVGWAWRAAEGGRLLRLGGQYYNGYSPQYSFYNEHEQGMGFGVWYDF